MPREEERKPVKAGFLLARMQDDIRSLNSSILIISEKMKYLVRNEKILGRNLIVLHKKIKALEEKFGLAQAGTGADFGAGAISGGSAESQQLALVLEEIGRQVAEMQAEVQSLRENMASKEELKEMHYVVESINPLQFATLDQVKEMIGARKAKPAKKK
ncbi:MAG: hypothetical protein Q8N60_04740 [Candidatus Diapherotrites archaeon]|nr:hypothetical protein [Candidatus Diapherotrites archaeon]